MSLGIALVFWYREHKRDLPWRQERDAYKIWVSEVMLQQTRVEVVKEYYDRWLQRFPTLEELAKASEEEVISYWQGLGYYSRARNLLYGVKEAKAQYGGHVPDTKEDLQKLSGIGEYTAGAILSIAYNKPEPAVDGNVLRVFSRLFAISEDISLPKTKKLIEQLVKQEMPEDWPGEFNQAIMDLGATICIPKAPRCEVCPVQGLCQGKAQGLQGMLPIKRKKNPPLEISIVAGLVCHNGKFLIRQRPRKGLLAGMWEFPACEVAAGENELDKLLYLFQAQIGLNIAVGNVRFEFSHIFSHRQWNLHFYDCSIQGEYDCSGCVWMDKEEWQQVSFAGPHRKVAEWITNGKV